MNLPSEKPDTSSRHERRRIQLESWLQEWTLHRAIPAADDAPPMPPNPLPDGPAPALSAAPRPGEIRLLFPLAGGPALDRTLYLAVLETSPGGAALVAPFSRFSTPAFPGEWATGDPATALRVLCLWNRRVVPAAWLRCSWRAARWGGRKTLAALGACAWEGDRHDADRDRPDVGPALLHPRDPRWLYLEAESRCMDEALAAVKRALTPDAWTGAPGCGDSPSQPWLKAAEPPPEYRTRKRP
jgi:hypothetical protein